MSVLFWSHCNWNPAYIILLLLGLYSPDNNYNESPVMILIFRLISGILFLIMVLYLLYRLVTGTWFGT